MDDSKKRKGNTNCCVVGCSNAYRNTTPDIVFYSFPKRKTEAERRKLWIQAVRRQNADGSTWEPTPATRICSIHFIGNKRSGHPQNPAYVPSIFPKNYKKKATSSQLASERYERAAKRRRKGEHLSNVEDAAVKNKCQNLRSNPMREKRKLKSSPSCCKAQRSKTTWPFMESMNLLDQTLQARETSGNVNCNILVGNEDLGNGNDRQCFHEEQLGTSTGMQSLAVLHDKLATAKQTGKKRRGRTAKNYFKHLNKTTTKQAEDINDPDLMFLQSLLPLIRHLSPLQNLEFKEEVINLLKQKFNLNQNYLCHIDGIVEDLKARRNSIAGTYPANSLHCEKERVETFDASPSVDSETVNIKSEDDISSNNEVEIKCEPNFDGEDDPLNANDISPNYEGEINCQMSSSCEDDPLNTHKSLNEECETKYQVSVKNEVDLLDVPLTDVKVECRSYEDFH
ncbi:uncharacterized protein [Periplaneta americana]|uniref:uncharacterized protein isoform X2 n=1 Tax=Periplaneta americana TaxID=6978 RepID=UPI0037E88900